ncbi:universal stress protein [Sulfitobacter sp. HNIBRBA3233]|uniref:universal stress protein n=1 Tax=Sulfitobacter marinivivus TaxID=3158558 RepID=UPI0032DF97B8
MYKKILVPMALDHGVSPFTLEIAQRLVDDGGEVIALHVYEAPQGSVTAYLDPEAVKEAFAAAKNQLEAKTKGMDGVVTDIVRGHTYRSIIDYSDANNIDCIVIGSHKPGFSDYLLGSTAARVVRHAPCAVHVHRTS